ncbi:hypothetical protein [Nocardia amamiensis]|nr:hypothetical protein [Nocardia amamiensis]
MRVAIDARYWRSSIQTGVERYIYLLTEADSRLRATRGRTPGGIREN